MIKEVYMGALEQKASGDEKSERNEIVHNMNKFCGNIQTSLQQAYGNVTLQIPDIPLDMDETEVVHNPSLMKELDSAVVSKHSNCHTFDESLKSVQKQPGLFELHTGTYNRVFVNICI